MRGHMWGEKIKEGLLRKGRDQKKRGKVSQKNRHGCTNA